MADGTDKSHILRGGRPLLQECRECRTRHLGQHVCAFLTGVFDPNNWNCGSMTALGAYATQLVGDEMDIWTTLGPAGSVVVWLRRIGQPQRVRVATVWTPGFEQVPVTLELVEHILATPR